MNFRSNDLVSENRLDSGLSFSLSLEFRFPNRGFEKSAISSGLTNGDRLFSIADRRLRLLWQIEKERVSVVFGKWLNSWTTPVDFLPVLLDLILDSLDLLLRNSLLSLIYR